VQRAVVVAVIAIGLGSLFVVTFSLALTDPVPHHIDAAVVGQPTANRGAVAAVERVAQGKISFSRYPSVAAALHGIDLQRIYTALDLTSIRPVLYVASAAGVSVARVLERAALVDPNIAVADAHPLSEHDPNGVEIFYLIFIATMIGFFTIYQARVNAPLPSTRHRIAFVLLFSAAVSLVLTLVAGPVLARIDLPVGETWGILALQVLAAACFAEVTSFALGRWAILPTFLFFVILGNASSGGIVAPPLLPQPFAFLSEWLPTGAAVSALRNAVYFQRFQHARPTLVLAAWAVALFATWLVIMHRQAARSGTKRRLAAAGPEPVAQP
jgi:hypothetical protein